MKHTLRQRRMKNLSVTSLQKNTKGTKFGVTMWAEDAPESTKVLLVLDSGRQKAA